MGFFYCRLFCWIVTKELQQNSAMFFNKKVDMLNYLRADVYSENGNFLKLCNQEGVSWI